MPLSHCPPWASVSPTVRWSDALQDLQAPGDGGRQEEAGSRVCVPPAAPGMAWGLVNSSRAPAHSSLPGTAFVLDAGPAGVAAARPPWGHFSALRPLEMESDLSDALVHSLGFWALPSLCWPRAWSCAYRDGSVPTQPLPLRALHSTGWQWGGRNRSWERSGGETVMSSCEASLGTQTVLVSSVPS